MPKFTVFRRKTYRVEVEAATLGEAQQHAEDVPGCYWQILSDCIIDTPGADLWTQHVAEKV